MADQTFEVLNGERKVLRDMGNGTFAEVVAPAIPLADMLSVVGTLQRPADVNAYATGDIIAQSVTAGSCSAIPMAVAIAVDRPGAIIRCRLKVDDPAWLGAAVVVHVFRDPPTFGNADNAAFAGGLTESNYVDAFDITLSDQFSDFVSGIGVARGPRFMAFRPHAGTQNVYAVLETKTAVTPASGATFTLEFEA
jgi:hypothetical protein